MALLEETLSLLAKSPLPLSQIAAEAGVELWWLRKLRQAAKTRPDKVDPRVRQLEKLHRFLSTQGESQDVGGGETCGGPLASGRRSRRVASA